MFKYNIQSVIISIIPTSYFIWTTDFTGACLVLLFLIILDLITGVRKAMFLKCLSSRIAIDKTVKKFSNYGTLLIVGYLINMFVFSLEPTGYAAKFFMDLLGDFVKYVFIVFAGFLIGVEGYSIIENLAIMGMPIPKKLISKWSKNVRDNNCDL